MRTTGMRKSAGSPPTSSRRAFSPPQDVPTTAIEYATIERRNELFHLPIHLLASVQLLIARLVLREAQRLLGPKRENAEHRQALVEQRVHVILQLAIEIDQDIPTENDIELRERPVGHEIVLREHDISRKRWTEQRAVILRGVILRE